MADEQVYSKRINLYVGPGGPTCPCCNVGNSKVRTRKMRAARRSERQRSRADLAAQVDDMSGGNIQELWWSLVVSREWDSVEEGRHHTDWWTWWLNSTNQ